MEFHGKTVLVTGASGGIGRSCALEFAKLGARVAVHYHTNPASAHETLHLLEGDRHLTISADIGDAGAVSGMIGQVMDAFGRLDVLINNAGVYDEQPIGKVDYETWHRSWARIVSVNLLGAANVAYAASQVMMAGDGGRIINISSRAAFRGKPDAIAYAASKAGLNALSQNLAIALAPHGIYVYIIAPTVVDTEMSRRGKDEVAWEAVGKTYPLGRVVRPEEIAHAAVFLSSPGAEMLTGGIIDMFGASYLRT